MSHDSSIRQFDRWSHSLETPWVDPSGNIFLENNRELVQWLAISCNPLHPSTRFMSSEVVLRLIVRTIMCMSILSVVSVAPCCSSSDWAALGCYGCCKLLKRRSSRGILYCLPCYSLSLAILFFLDRCPHETFVVWRKRGGLFCPSLWYKIVVTLVGKFQYLLQSVAVSPARSKFVQARW